ncbi:MAG: LmbE-like protein [Limisphaerales bacterium]|nr:MAG: LmbE-like protein [Limisphaerales bacterium]KAG0509675.1 MAG: LmbE-like protein [Limisphaerales bacterium]TXT51206.1 MAG: LmbE-like protein [Limisphaerales bacterium]
MAKSAQAIMKTASSRRRFLTSLSLAAAASSLPAAAPAGDGKLRVICFGAHPDDCELQAGGVGAMWAERGHQVKLVAVTNGDIGHWREAGGPLALRRKREVEEASKILGTTVQVLDIHDGELEPNLETRRQITRLIRAWRADIVFSPRPNDYHPDHRYTGVLVQDAAFMVGVPFICPDVPPLTRNPVFMYYTDRFQKPNPSTADIAVSIDSVIEKKLDALAVMESQFLEGGALGHAGLLPRTPADKPKRVAAVRASQSARYLAIADRFRKELKQWYGEERGAAVKHAEAFEICEYGRRPDKAELKQLFPFFG